MRGMLLDTVQCRSLCPICFYVSICVVLYWLSWCHGPCACYWK